MAIVSFSELFLWCCIIMELSVFLCSLKTVTIIIMLWIINIEIYRVLSTLLGWENSP